MLIYPRLKPLLSSIKDAEAMITFYKLDVDHDEGHDRKYRPEVLQYTPKTSVL